jgi:hypothetical protein
MYRDTIRQSIARRGHIGISPEHVEAWMRIEHSTLDALSPQAFDAEVGAAIECVNASTLAENDALAESYGF